MQKTIAALLALLLLTGCSSNAVPEVTPSETGTVDIAATESIPAQTTSGIPYQSRFDAVTEILLSDESIQVDGGEETDAVFISNDIIYYEDKESYSSGNPYGEGTEEERHSAEEAAAHTVVNIAKPGAYRLSGKLSAGQIRVDLGEDAYEDPEAVVELILDDADITCTVAPAILFLNTYECDGNWSTETAQSEVNTTGAGANLILEGNSTVSGSHVAKIFKDKDGEKKLWKQDGAIYSYMSMNVFGPGSLELTADNEGLDTELHLTINGGDIRILSDNDGINTNEDGVSVTTINGGNLTIFAGLGAEGDGIDSNGYLVINGGNVVSAANPKADAGLDSDLGSFINGGTVIAMGSTMDWAESDSEQVTMNLQFASQQKAGSKIVITQEDETEIFSFESDSEYARSFSGLILSHAAFTQGETYYVYVDDEQMCYTGNDVGRGGPGGMGQRPEMPEGMEFPEGERPEMPEGMEFPEGERPEMPEGMEPGQRMELPEGETMPEGFDPSNMGGRGQRPENSEDRQPPEGFEGEMPTWPEGEIPEMPEGGFGGRGGESSGSGEASTEFYMNDKVNAFSGVMVMAEATA